MKIEFVQVPCISLYICVSQVANRELNLFMALYSRHGSEVVMLSHSGFPVCKLEIFRGCI